MAQGSARSMRAEIPFTFSVGEKILSAGTYTFAREDTGQILVRGGSGASQSATLGQVLTRLGSIDPHASQAQDAFLVFDRFGQDHILSEVWFPEQDGFEIRGRNPDVFHDHPHVRIKATVGAGGK
jgi:hypothetical protein